MTVTPETIAVALGRAIPTDTEWSQWAMWITDAQMLIDARIYALAAAAGEVATVTNKVLNANVATLATLVAHGFGIDDVVVVAGVDATFNGTHTVTAVTATTFSYAKVATNVATVATTGTATKNALDEIRVDYVIREAVVVQVRRPDDATVVTVAVQDASTSKTYRSSRGRVEIRDEWWVLLGLTSASSGAFALDTAWNTGVHAAICSLNFGALYCSCGADLTNYAYPLFEHENSIALVDGWSFWP